MSRVRLALLLSVLMAAPGAVVGTEPAPRGRALTPEIIDFTKVPRKIDRLPELKSKTPLYGLFLFGLHGQTRVWAVLDQTAPGADSHDILYLDLNANGDLTEKAERHEAQAGTFTIGSFLDPGQKNTTHTEFTIQWTGTSIRYSMLWHGKKRTFGAFGPRRELYARLGTSIENAPIFVPGYDRPLQFDHWMCDKLTSGATTDFKVFVGQRGSTRGSFSSVDDKFLANGQKVQATLVYTDGRGKEQRVRALLGDRC